MANKIRSALTSLGYTHGKVIVKLISFNRYEVTLNAEYFGIYDTVKNNWVD